MAVLFWLGVAGILYVHAGYPLLLWLLARRRREEPLRNPDPWPTVTLLIAAHNEERVLEAKLANSLALDYPPDRLEIAVVSDGATDRTDAIAAAFAPRGVRLIRLAERQGKTAAQNAAVSRTAGEIVVFSDANAFYAPDALRWLVRPFTRADVGCVEGRRSDFAAHASATANHELAYRDWESRLKTWESRVDSCTGATGPIYAVRRSLYVPLDPALISDLMEPLLIRVRHGKRHVFEPAAISREETHGRMRDEFWRKVRIMTRCLNSLRRTPETFDPRRAGAFAWQVISHRMLRWFVPVLALLVLAANLTLLDRPFYRVTLLLQAAFGAAAALGAVLDRLARGPVSLRLPYYFCAANLAALVALGHCLLGRNPVTWRPERAPAP